MSKHLTKEELEQDPLLETYARATNYFEEHKSTIIAAAAGIILVVGAAIGYYFYQQSQEQKAQQLLGFAEQQFMQGNYEKALNGDEQDFTVGFAQILNKYSGTDAGNLANYYAAVCEYNLGEPQKALDYIKDFDVPEGIMGVGPIAFHATVLNEVGEHTKAAQMYLKAAEWDDNDSTTPYNLYQAAEAYYSAEDYKQAQKQVDRILSDYADTQIATKATELKGRLLTVASR